MRKLSRVLTVVAVLAAVLSPATSAAAHGGGDAEDVHIPGSVLAEVRAAVAPYHSIARAEQDGWGLLPVCFQEPSIGGMGLHWVQGVDLALDPLRPEALVYTPSPSGEWKLGAVEYIVPMAPWDAVHEDRPELFGVEFHDGPLDLYVLHVWLFKNNPAGLTDDFNPKVALCP